MVHHILPLAAGQGVGKSGRPLWTGRQARVEILPVQSADDGSGKGLIVGPWADPARLWRASLSDEAWREGWGVPEDAECRHQVARDSGVDLRPGE